MADTTLQVLDLSGAPERPTVKLPQGDYELRLPEELTFVEFAEQQRIGKETQELAADAGDPEVLEKLQANVAAGAQLILVDLEDEVAAELTPGMFLKISAFFRRLGDEIVAPPSGSGEGSATGSNGSTEEDQAEE